MSLKFDELYVPLNNLISSYLELVSSIKKGKRLIALLSEGELKEIPLLEKELLTIYNNSHDDINEEVDIIEIDQLTNAVLTFYLDNFIEHFKFKINDEITRTLSPMESDLKVNLILNEESYKNFVYEEVKSLLLEKIIEAETTKFIERKVVLRTVIQEYFTIRGITFMAKGKLINAPWVQVW
ncbi:hypothetical protein [Peribacillus frigoritolerans]|uniref:hypothetical protein n=1 Tax=Peribacillus frigoritolerans TaxID=450367 RepID=UPI0024C1AEFD|nr:hypothetical protein [Peribacillus frigoritolerans]WHX63762.1 hypothetical protein QNH33_09475 [Peribacillus frigoritolerans]